MPHDTPIRVWLDEATKLALLRRAAEDDRPVSVYVRRLIERDLDESVVPDLCGGKCRSGSDADRSR